MPDFRRQACFLCGALCVWLMGGPRVQLQKTAWAAEPLAINAPGDGYRGIWYFNQKSGDEYVYKYSGGLGTYCAKHRPFAVYRPQVEKTFFCYGGTTRESHRRLLHMVSYYDHKTGTVPRPTILLDKKTDDAHDNPVIAVDEAGYVWIFSTSHGRSRPSYIHRSKRPYQIEAFELVDAVRDRNGAHVAIDNFSYMQAWHLPRHGFACFFTRYNDPVQRTNFFMTSADGVRWSAWRRLAAIDWGHYQISTANEEKAVAVFNYHPDGKGLNWRTNLYYIETGDFGKSWQTVDGKPLEVPLTKPANAALVHDYAAEKRNVYLKDIRLDAEGRPVILYLTSKGYQSGPRNEPRTWTTARWTGRAWDIRPVTTSDNNYDMGSLYLEDGTWRIIAPTEPGPQRYNPGGEMAMWISRDQGRSWEKTRQLTAGSLMNHTYARRPVDAHPDFYALWADGHGREPSPSRLYFCNRDGDVFRLPRKMAEDFARPEKLPAYVSRRDDLFRFHPAPGGERRMHGGVLEGTPFDPHEGPYFAIHTIEDLPKSGWNEVSVDLRDFRAIRYRGPGSSFGMVAEIELVRDGEKLTGRVFGKPAGDEGKTADYRPAFDGDPQTIFRHREGSNIYLGLDTELAKD